MMTPQKTASAACPKHVDAMVRRPVAAVVTAAGVGVGVGVVVGVGVGVAGAVFVAVAGAVAGAAAAAAAAAARQTIANLDQAECACCPRLERSP